MAEAPFTWCLVVSRTLLQPGEKGHVSQVSPKNRLGRSQNATAIANTPIAVGTGSSPTDFSGIEIILCGTMMRCLCNRLCCARLES